MRWYQRLRWRLIGAPLLGVLVGASTMVVITYVFAFRTAPELLRIELTALLADPGRLVTTEGLLLETFQRTVFTGIALAAGGAVIAGVVYSFILWRSLVMPLRQIATSSQRIADGRYSERVDVTDNVGEAIFKLVNNFNNMAEVLEHTEEKRISLIGNVTHELRTPLTSLQGYLEGMEDGLFPASEETFAIMKGEVARLSRLVADIQTLSRVEAGAIHLKPRSFDLSEVAGQIRDQFQPQAQAAGVELRLRPAAGKVVVHADRDRVIQILTNLTGNALRYTPHGGTIDLIVRASSDSGQGEIAVVDSGAGIPAEALPFIFERFYRVDDSRSRDSGGSGVGLTISRHLAWMMGGELTAASEGAGRGSTFVLLLPPG